MDAKGSASLQSPREIIVPIEKRESLVELFSFLQELAGSKHVVAFIQRMTLRGRRHKTQIEVEEN